MPRALSSLIKIWANQEPPSSTGLAFNISSAPVGLGHVGLVMGLEVSRLARSSLDWHHLLEICTLTETLILDEDGLYDPATFNDRLLLGLYVRYHLERSGR